MIDKLPTELISEEVIKHCTAKDEYNLMLTCKHIHRATKDHFLTHKPKPNLICWANLVHHDSAGLSYNTWILEKDARCSTNNYYDRKGDYRSLQREFNKGFKL